MITIIEKRIQELEDRIPIFLAKIEEQQSKMEEIFSFPNDLAEVRTICQTLNGVLKEFMDTQNSGFGDVNSKISSFFSALSDLKSVIDNEVKSNLSTMSSQISGQSAAIGNQKALQSALENNHNDLVNALTSISERVALSENKIEKDSQVIGSVNDKLNNHIFDYSNSNVSIVSQIEDVKQLLKDAVFSINSSFNTQLAQVASQIKELPEIPVPKDYDAFIADIKNDIVSILSLVHTTATQGIDPKINDRIKQMELSISQIYMLMKKYETGI